MKNIEGKYTLPNGEVLEVHINQSVAVNLWRGEEWMGFEEVSLEEFNLTLSELAEDGEIKFEPKHED